MEIEAKPVITPDYVRLPLEYLQSAKSVKMDDQEWHGFVQRAQAAFLSDMQQIAEIAFTKGREYERRNPK